ncbi:hypothetical protein HAX54_036817 [Datura stramonium]|uniref:Uncharacterized protein n=1 Tax=Datura stramonium TaxID=4076 RepID=A0ABS8RN09_DATST|nr:hypothetical protein [Datura stramonium]
MLGNCSPFSSQPSLVWSSSPLPVGAWAFLGLTTSSSDPRLLTFQSAFGAFTNEVIWLIVISFFFARGFVKTGLGDRIATYFVKLLGKSTLAGSKPGDPSSRKLGSCNPIAVSVCRRSSALFTAAAQNLLCLK